MNWRERAALAVKGPTPEPTKPTEAPFGSFVSTPPGHVSQKEAANGEDSGPSEERKRAALEFLAAHPNVARACFAHPEAEKIVLTVAVRDPWGVLEVEIERSRFDALALMELAKRYPETSLRIPEH